MNANIDFLRQVIRMMELGKRLEVIDFANRYAKFYDANASITIGSLS